MAVDGRYRWVLEEAAGILDALDRPRTVAIGIEDERVILQIGTGSPGTWISLPPAAAAAIGLHLQTAAVTIDQRKQES